MGSEQKINNVKSIKVNEIKVGQLLAKQGAWNRKYRVVHIQKPHKDPNYTTMYEVVCTLKFLGNHYASGKITKPSREVLHDVVTLIHSTDGVVEFNYVAGFAAVEPA